MAIVKEIRTDDVRLTSSFQPQQNSRGQWVAPAGGANLVTTTRTFTFQLPNDARPRPEDEAKGGIWARVVVGNTNRDSLPYGWKVASVTPRNSYITAGTTRINVTFSFQSDTKGGPWDFAGRHTKKSTVAFERISLIIYYESASGEGKNNYTGHRTQPPRENVTYTEYTANTDITLDSSAYKNCITIYEPDSTEFVTNGLSILQPKSCIVTEQAGGSWELEMVHPITPDDRWRLLEVDRIIRAPVPVRQNPEMAIRAKREGISVHEIYKATSTVNLREKPNTKLSTRIIRKLLKDEQVEVLEVDSWCKVVTKAGQTGYVAHNYIEFVRQQETSGEQDDGEQYNSVVVAQQTRNQTFRIYHVQVDSVKQEVSVNARHLSYDFASNLVKEELKATNVLLSTFLERLQENLAVTDERTIDTDITNQYVNGQWSFMNPLSILLDPDTGIVQQLQCQLVRDTHNIYLMENKPADRGYLISYGKNLKSLKWSYNTEQVVTRILPTGQNKKGDVLLLPETFVDSEHIEDYPVVRCSRLEVAQAIEGGEYTDEKTGEIIDKKLDLNECYDLMREAARKEYENGCDLPQVDVQVDFTALETTEEYKELAGLYQLYLYDTVHIRHEPLGYEADAQVYETVFDCIAGRYNSIKLGDIFKQNVQTVAGYQISEGSVSGTKIAPSTITGTALADASITNAKIGLAAITAANINDLNADSITAGTLKTERLIVTGEASIAGQLNNKAQEAIAEGKADKETVLGYIANDALAVTDEGLVMKSGGKIQIVAGAEFTVDATNLDIDEQGTLECRNASVSGSVSVNGNPVLTSTDIYIGTNAPEDPHDGMVWIKPTGGSTSTTFQAYVEDRLTFAQANEIRMSGSGALYSGDDARYAITIPIRRSYASPNNQYVRATISDGTTTVDLGAYAIRGGSAVGLYQAEFEAHGPWVCSGDAVTLRVWLGGTPTGTGVVSVSSSYIPAGTALKITASGAGGADTGWQSCAVQYYQS